jgi:hypothetical protein
LLVVQELKDSPLVVLALEGSGQMLRANPPVVAHLLKLH